jgi:hypothetical protein
MFLPDFIRVKDIASDEHPHHMFINFAKYRKGIKRDRKANKFQII